VWWVTKVYSCIALDACSSPARHSDVLRLLQPNSNVPSELCAALDGGVIDIHRILN